MPLHKMASIVTDGAPAMIGNLKGVGVRIMNEVQKTKPEFSLTVLHCMIHQQVLCSKTFEFDYILEDIISIIKYLRNSPLVYRQFKNFLRSRTNFKQMPYFTKVRWLSCHHVLQRFCKIQLIIIDFLKQQGVYDRFKHIEEPEWQIDFCFFTDLSSHLFELQLNVNLQGKSLMVNDLYDKINAFVNIHLDRLTEALKTDQIEEYFPVCHALKRKTENRNLSFSGYVDLILSLKKQFNERFQDFKELEPDLVVFQNPFDFNPNSKKPSFYMVNELSYISGRSPLKRSYQQKSLEFYQNFPES